MPLTAYEFPLIKATATGNDFLLVDLLNARHVALWKKEFGAADRAGLAKTWCDRYTGLGADGLVILEGAPAVDFAWDFYNSDGSRAEMCGNAARAVSLYVSDRTGRPQLKFVTRVGVITAHVHSAGDVEIYLPAIKDQQWSVGRAVATNRYPEDFDFVLAGVPHAVVKTSNLENIPELTERALQIKGMDQFKKDGTNVTFVKAVGADHIQTKTFERGVEGFTRSCGTGAVAAAHSVLRGKENQTVTVDVPGGRLSVIWKDGKPILRGPAKIVGEMRWIK